MPTSERAFRPNRESSPDLLTLVGSRTGHFRLESGHHSELWLDLDQLFAPPAALQPFVAELASRVATYGIDTVCGPLYGGAFLAEFVALQLGVEFAFAEASLRGAPLLALHVWQRDADAPPSRTGVVGYDMDAARGEARQRLADVVTPWADKYPDVQVELLVRHGLDAAIALTAASHAAQLAVVGASGCVARVLLQRAQCATAVIPV